MYVKIEVEKQTGYSRQRSPERQRLLDSPHSTNFGMKEESWADACAPVQDNPNAPALTARVFILGILWSIFISVVNTVFSFRKNHFHVHNTIIVLLAYPMGLFAEVVVPNYRIFGVELNPGPFNVKELVLISLVFSS